MKRFLKIFLTLIFPITLFGQIYDPQILVLTVNELEYEKELEEEINRVNYDFNVNSNSEDYSVALLFEGYLNSQENMKRMTVSELAFRKDFTFNKYPTQLSQMYLAYRFYEYFENLLILPSSQKSNGELQHLKEIAEREEMQFILNFPKVKLFKKDGESFAKISVQLYDSYTNSMLIDTIYEGASYNPGFEFSCEDGTIFCTIHNALSETLAVVINKVALNSTTVKRLAATNQKRTDILLTEFYSNTYDINFLKSVLTDTDLGNLFQVLTDSSQTKFVAFFTKHGDETDSDPLSEGSEPKHIEFISSNDDYLNSENYNSYGYIIYGVKYEGRWFYKESKNTYFKSRNLEEAKRFYFARLAQWDFFKPNTAEVDPNFWETYFFEKVESTFIKNKEEFDYVNSTRNELKTILEVGIPAELQEFFPNGIESFRMELEEEYKELEEDYEDLIESFEEQDERNREYFGLYKIVVDQLKKEKKD